MTDEIEEFGEQDELPEWADADQEDAKPADLKEEDDEEGEK
jgi:hypothetical protein